MYEKITLPNGVRIVTEQVDHVRSASVGIWVHGYGKVAMNPNPLPVSLTLLSI